MSAAPDWSRFLRAVAALMVDPDGLGGMVIRARAGPVRQVAECTLTELPLPARRIHPGIDDRQLFGGLNLAASLAAGHLLREAGLSEVPCTLVLPMAERTTRGLAGRLARLLETGPGHALILLDEGATPEDMAPPALSDRLAFHADLSEVAARDALIRLPAPADLDRARALTVLVPDATAAQLTRVAAGLGIDSARAPLLALRTARALAALDGTSELGDAHLREACELVYPSRATRLPEPPPEDADAPPQEPAGETAEPGDSDTGGPLAEQVIAAIAARLPADLLTRLADRRAVQRRSAAGSSGAGARRPGNRRGRPLPARPGRPTGRSRIDVIATLRAAAPWQKLRRGAGEARLILRPADIRLKRYEDRSDRLVIFAVDASGSAAMARMAEAKGAIELLLAQAYAQRDQVALVAFRGDSAEILLPPTRALVQAKKRLSALPCGGGTPLPAGLRAVFDLAVQGQRAGLTPGLALLTDGRGNVALDGTPGRARARDDSRRMARRIAALGLRGMVIDTAPRPGPESADLARWLDAGYLALPRAGAEGIQSAVTRQLGG